jgi:hypothetical protein
MKVGNELVMPDKTNHDQTSSDIGEIIGEAGSFEITGFRAGKFENHEEDTSKIDSISDSPAIVRAFRLFNG